VLHGTGILDVADLKALDWHVLLLLGGGSALGRAIRESGLLHEVGDMIIWTMGADASPFALLSVFVAAILVITNFVSHTVASITMMPVVVEVVRCSLGKSVGQHSRHAPLRAATNKSRVSARPLRPAVCPRHQRRLCAARLLLPQHLHFQRAAGRRQAGPLLQRLRQDRHRRCRRFFFRLCCNRVSPVVFTHKVLLSQTFIISRARSTTCGPTSQGICIGGRGGGWGQGPAASCARAGSLRAWRQCSSRSSSQAART
jgi:hypothetical protein